MTNLTNKSKSIKKTPEKELNDAADEEPKLGGEETPTSGDESESEVVDKKFKKAATKEETDRKERQCTLKINIKHTKGQSQHS